MWKTIKSRWIDLLLIAFLGLTVEGYVRGNDSIVKAMATGFVDILAFALFYIACSFKSCNVLGN